MTKGNENQTSANESGESPFLAQEWVVCGERLPPEGEIVHTKIDDGYGVRNVQSLVRRGRLWFTSKADNAMYVYYTPTHWKSLGRDGGKD